MARTEIEVGQFVAAAPHHRAAEFVEQATERATEQPRPHDEPWPQPGDERPAGRGGVTRRG